MKQFISCSILLFFVISSCKNLSSEEKKTLFDGKTFAGWEGDTILTWHIENETITGGSLHQTVPQNDFLSTDRSYANFILKLKIKLTGNEGFIN
jgi:hypothetical protein